MTNKGSIEFLTGNSTEEVLKRSNNWGDKKPIERLFAGDPSLWIQSAKPGDDIPELTNRLGWLELPGEMLKVADEIKKFADGLRSEFDDVVLLGMGGSSLAPQMFMSILGNADGYPELTVLDTTNPETILGLTSSIDLSRTLFVVSSKSGGTIETLSLYMYFSRLMESVHGKEWGRFFIAITDPGSKLEKIAEEKEFRKCFRANPEVGGRYSALSHFGIVPAALIGIDIKNLLQRASKAVEDIKSNNNVEKNSSLRLGLFMGEMATLGRNKLGFMLSEEFSPLGDWIEQLIAESLGKDGKSILPVLDDMDYALSGADDNLTVYLGAGEPTEEFAALKNPKISISINKPEDIAEQIIIWEVATAIAGAVMSLNPFNQPNVESAKVRAKELMAEYERRGKLPSEEPVYKDKEFLLTSTFLKDVKNPISALREFALSVDNGGYIMVMAYLPYDEEVNDLVSGIVDWLAERCSVPVCSGYGPRFLHSSGQLHKGDDGSGLFLQLTHSIEEDLDIPGEKYSFGTLITAQAGGDYAALKDVNRRVLRINIKKDLESSLQSLLEELGESLI
ncbi:MAG: hypothetical protein JW737_03020 [Acidobacteria bacterium]|nr:hypothetical protein [Acidobacteriota bacterium]